MVEILVRFSFLETSKIRSRTRSSRVVGCGSRIVGVVKVAGVPLAVSRTITRWISNGLSTLCRKQSVYGLLFMQPLPVS